MREEYEFVVDEAWVWGGPPAKVDLRQRTGDIEADTYEFMLEMPTKLRTDNGARKRYVGRRVRIIIEDREGGE